MGEQEQSRDPLLVAAEERLDQMIETGQSRGAKDQALLDLLTVGKDKPS